MRSFPAATFPLYTYTEVGNSEATGLREASAPRNGVKRRYVVSENGPFARRTRGEAVGRVGVCPFAGFSLRNAFSEGRNYGMFVAVLSLCWLFFAECLF